MSTNIIVNDFNFELFPNPSLGSFNLNFNDSKQHNIKVYDSKGKLIKELNNQFSKSVLDLNNYSSGSYTIEVMPESITYQILKQ